MDFFLMHLLKTEEKCEVNSKLSYQLEVGPDIKKIINRYHTFSSLHFDLGMPLFEKRHVYAQNFSSKR